MAIRNILTEGDETLVKKSREVGEITPKILTLLDDMKETMYSANGVGLAAPQVGVLRRIALIDAGDGLLELINPVILEQEGEQEEIEGCLSIPGVHGIVVRPARVVVEALDRNGKLQRYEGTELLARAFCHEIDHLDGILFDTKAVRFLTDEELQELQELQEAAE
jgi:peptide deformylase